MTTAAFTTTDSATEHFSSPTKKGLTGSTIKLIAIIAMLIDHTAATILERMIMREGYMLAATNSEWLSEWIDTHWLLYFSYMTMREIGRFGFPIFCFLLVEGFLHTHNRKKYAMRLFLFALISEIPFDFAFRGKWFYSGYQNVFFTLFLGMLAMCAFDWLKNHLKGGMPGAVCLVTGILFTGCYGSLVCNDIVYPLLEPFLHIALGDTAFFIARAIFCAVITAFVLLVIAKKHDLLHAQVIAADLGALCLTAYAADLLKTDYAGMGVITIALMYAFRKSRVKSMLAGCISLTLMQISEASAFLMLIPISKYNGQRGWNLKYVFYAFYPVHLGLLYLICLAMGLA